MQSCGCGCYVRNVCVSILLYADCVLLLAPSVQQLLYECDKELQCLDMSINVKKSVCMRIGARYNINSSRISALNGGEIIWPNDMGLGVQITASNNKFCCLLCNSKRSFNGGFNCIFDKVGGIASENVIIELLKAKCLPGLYYELQACPLNKSQSEVWSTYWIMPSWKYSC